MCSRRWVSPPEAARASTTSVVVGYAVAGAVVAGLLERRGMPRGTVLGALAAWPLMLPLLQDAPVSVVRAGPLALEIEACVAALMRTLADPAAVDVPVDADLLGLRSALLAADARLGLVDRVLADAPHGPAEAEVRAARASGERSIREVLEELHQLRMQVGLAALAGGSAGLRHRLVEISNRGRALSEVAMGAAANCISGSQAG
jgi:hypothetical protein